MKYILEFLNFICAIFFNIIEIKLRQFFSYINFIYLWVLNFIIFLLKKFIFNFNGILKLFLFSVVFFTFLVFLVNFFECIILYFANFVIGLREAFSNSTREYKLYLINLYIFLAYFFVKRKSISLKIYKYIESFKNKYFYSKDKENIEKYKNVVLFLVVYFSICFIGLLFYQINGNGWTEKNKGDIINIFIWATYLLAPIVAIWVYSDWREPHKLNKKLELINQIDTEILALENKVRELNVLIDEYLNNLNRPYSELQLEYNKFTRKMANLEILSRQLEMSDELNYISKSLSRFNYSFIQFSLFPSALLSILKNEDIDSWESNKKEIDINHRILLLSKRDDREKWLSNSYGDVFEIQKELIKLKKEYIF